MAFVIGVPFFAQMIYSKTLLSNPLDLDYRETGSVFMQKRVSSLLLFLLAISTVTLALKIKPARADAAIYVNADGSITPSTAPILTFDNVTYSFTGNINESIVVQRNNTIIDGSGYTVQGSGAGNGMDLNSVSNVTIENMSVTGFSKGIYLNYSSNNLLLNNQATGNYNGIVLDSSSYNRLRDSYVTENPACGIFLFSSCYNDLTGNVAIGNAGLGGAGIYLSSSTCNTLSRNNVTSNYYGVVLYSSSVNVLFQNIIEKSFGRNFVIDGSILSDYINSVDPSNLVNGKPAYYIVNQDDLVMDPSSYPSIGYLAIVNCTGITVENMTLTNNEKGLLLAYTNNSTIIKNNFANDDYGIYLYSSCENAVFSNNITRNTLHGIELSFSSHNTVLGNSITGNGVGIYLDSSPNNQIVGNNMVGNGGGIGLDSATNDTLSRNNVGGSTSWGISSIFSSHNTFSDNTVTRNDFQGITLYACFDDTISGNNVTGNFGDGIYIYYHCFNETVCDNSATENTGSGIVLYTSYNNTVIISNVTLFGNNVSVNPSDSVSDDEWANSTVRDNNVTGNLDDGIALIRTSGNTVSDNNILKNWYGIIVDNASNNAIYHNNFINNTHQAAMSIYGMNIWDNGYPSGGNYWSDNGGADLYSCSYPNEAGSDGIGDAPYVIDTNNTDQYPQIGLIESFVAGTWNGTTCHVNIASNSTISNMLTDIVGKTISFNITGPDATHGFCRVTIPNLIVQDLWRGNYSVLVNNEEWSFANWTDATNTYVYINYTNSEHKVVIIPEFPPSLAVWLFAAFLVVAFALAKKKET
jgi:parallel beta-helix repeat protein